MFFRKNRRDPDPWPNWLKWALVAFLVLAFMGNMRNKNAGTLPQAFHNAAENLNPQKLLPIESYKNILFPQYGTQLRINDTAPGVGTPAVCGQQVKIAYNVYEDDNAKPVDAGQTLLFSIGEGKVVPALEQGVTGMKKDGKRSVFSPPNMAYGAKEFARQDIPANASVRFEVELLEATPAMPSADATPYRIASVALGNGSTILCGEPAKVQVTLWSIDGKKLFSSDKPLTFTPGKSEVFMGLEQGVIGMNQGGIRTLVVPPAFQKTMRGNAPAIDFPFPKDQTVLVDVEAIP